jgi:hypothetical protein
MTIEPASTTFDLYGCSLSLSDARAFLEPLLALQFDERESTYYGGIYFRFGDQTSENLILKRNVDPFDGEPVEMEHADFPVLFYVNRTSRASYFERVLAGASNVFLLLRRQSI